MFDNVGRKLKKIAKRQCILFIIIYFFLGILFFSIEEIGFMGWVFILISIFGTPIFATILYGFGELIDRVTEISLNIRNNTSNPVIITSEDKTKIDNIIDFIYNKRGKLIMIFFLIFVVIGITFAYFSASITK